MASVRELKKDINFVLGDFIEAVYIWENDTNNKNSDEGNALIDKAIGVFDELMQKVNQNGVENTKAHFKAIRQDLANKTTSLIEELNKLA